MRKIIASIFLCCLATQISHAQIDLEEVEVRSKSIVRKGISISGLSTTILSDSLLKGNSASTLSEVLSTQMGVVINGATQSPGSVQTVFFRGATRGFVLILVNGVPVYDASDISQVFDLNSIPLNQIEKIEILRGGQSVVYGSDAVAGVINIITKSSSQNKIENQTSISGGSFGSFNLGTNVSGKFKNTSFQVGYSTTTSNGISAAFDQVKNNSKAFEKDGLKRSSLVSDVRHNFNDKFSANMNVRITDYKADLDAGAFTDDNDFVSSNSMIQVGFGGVYSLKKGFLTANYFRNNTKRNYKDDSTDVPANAFSKYSLATYDSFTDFAELYGNFELLPNWNLLAGAEMQQFSMEQTYYSVSNFGPFESPKINKGDSKFKNVSAYLTSRYKKSNYGVELGGRLNYSSIYLTNTSYNINPFYETKHVRVSTSIGRSYKNPSLYQLFSEYGNKDLKPQNAFTFEAGFELYSNAGGNFTANYFNRTINDLIFFNSINEPPYGQYINLDNVQESGLELAYQKIYKKVNLNLNYTTIFASKTLIKATDEKLDNVNFLRRPKNVLNTSFTFAFTKKLNVNLSTQSMSTRKDRFYNSATFKSENVDLKPFTLLNALVNYKFTDKISVSLSGNNLTNAIYTETYGFSTRPINFNIGVVFGL